MNIGFECFSQILICKYESLWCVPLSHAIAVYQCKFQELNLVCKNENRKFSYVNLLLYFCKCLSEAVEPRFEGGYSRCQCIRTCLKASPWPFLVQRRMRFMHGICAGWQVGAEI